MSEFERKFVLKHTVLGISEMEDGKDSFSEREIHFRIPWHFSVEPLNGHLASYLHCDFENGKDEWEIEVEVEMKLISPSEKHSSQKRSYTFNDKNKGWGSRKFLKWEEIQEKHLVDDKITMEYHVKIIKTNGILKEKLRNFDEKLENLTDVTLIVGDRNFNVSKMTLAAQSSYFNTLFFGKFAEAGKEEIELKDIDPDDFQDFIELIYGELAIIKENIEGLLNLAEMYDAPSVIKRCEHFLTFEKPDFPLKDKLRLSSKFKMENLKKKCLEDIKTVSEIRAVVPADLSQLDLSVSNALLQKMLDLSNDK